MTSNYSLNMISFLIALAVPAFANAAVIYSSCPVITVDQKSVHREAGKTSAPQARLRNFADITETALYAWAWLVSEKKTLAIDPQNYAEDARRTGRWIEDLQLMMMLASKDQADCLSTDAPVTKNLAIFPFVRKPANGPVTREAVRVRYKLCEYYVDDKRQIPFEEACTVLGSEEGYSFTELENRYAQFKIGMSKSREFVNYAVAGAGLAAVLPTSGILRLARLGKLTSFAGAATLWTGVAGGAIHFGYTDIWIKDLVDLEGAAEIAIQGDLATAVKVSRPMQDFAPYFERYLESIREARP